jgi:hypothetical protein
MSIVDDAIKLHKSAVRHKKPAKEQEEKLAKMYKKMSDDEFLEYLVLVRKEISGLQR